MIRYCQNMEDARLALAGMGENCELLLSCQVIIITITITIIVTIISAIIVANIHHRDENSVIIDKS